MMTHASRVAREDGQYVVESVGCWVMECKEWFEQEGWFPVHTILQLRTLINQNGSSRILDCSCGTSLMTAIDTHCSGSRVDDLNKSDPRFERQKGESRQNPMPEPDWSAYLTRCTPPHSRPYKIFFDILLPSPFPFLSSSARARSPTLHRHVKRLSFLLLLTRWLHESGLLRVILTPWVFLRSRPPKAKTDHLFPLY